MRLGSWTSLLLPPTLESLMLKVSSQVTEGIMANKDVAEVVHTPRSAYATRRSFSNKKMNEKTGFSAEKVDTSQSDKAKMGSTLEAFTCSSSEPLFWSSLSAQMSAFLTCKKGIRHILYCTFVMAIITIAVLRLFWFGWLAFHYAMELPNSTVLRNLQNEQLWSMKGMLGSVDQAHEKSEEATFESRKAVYSMEEKKLWERPTSEGFQQCINCSRSYKGPKATPNGYIMVNANGGLNQMRDGVFTTNFFLCGL